MSETILGIEAGGTRTTLILSNTQGELIHQRVFGPGNFRVIGKQGLLDLLKSCANDEQDPACVCLGLAGVRDDRDRGWIIEAAREIWPNALIWVDHDLASALIVAQRNFKKADSHVLVLSGTGSCCFGRDKEGKEAKCGGWGHHLGDRGSSYDIAHSAIRAVIQHFDQTGSWPKLGGKLLQASMHNDPNDWIPWFQQASKTEIAALAVAVFEAFKKRDPLARGVIYQAALALVTDAIACWKRLESKTCYFVLAGGVFLKQPAFTRLFKRLLREIKEDAQIAIIPVESAWGTIYAGLDLHASSKVRRSRNSQSAARHTRTPLRDQVLPVATQISPTEIRLPLSRKLDVMSRGKAMDLFLAEDESIPSAIREEKKKILKWISWVTEGLKKGGRLFYVGAGTSGRLGILDASECPPTFGVPASMIQGVIAGGRTAIWESMEGAEDDFKAGFQTLQRRGFDRRDMVLGIAASGRTPFVHGALSYARSLGARQGMLCFNPHLEWPRDHHPDVVICPEVGPEILTGSTRLKAGTATKLVLNMITTLSMVGIGKVKSNLMIDVRASNEKLRDRAIRMVVTLTDVNYDLAHSTLLAAGWDIQQACLILEGKGDRPKA